jgi:peptidoglycan/LPS O-acetylase OafA/YrhL
MNRTTALVVIAVALGVYGLYAASSVPAMVVGARVPALLFAFVLQAACALAAAVGAWRRDRWAAGAAVLLGICIAATSLFEGFVPGIVAYLRAVLVAAIAVVVTMGIATYVSRQRSKGDSRGAQQSLS